MMNCKHINPKVELLIKSLIKAHYWDNSEKSNKVIKTSCRVQPDP